MSQKTALIGLDGVPWRLLQQWLEQGCLPNLAQLPTRGELLSPLPISPVAWTTLATGRSPWEHGVWGFSQSRDRKGPWVLANASVIRHAPLWQRVAQAGGTAMVANYPMSYPASVSAAGINGVSVVSGWIGAPPGATDVVWPLSLAKRLGEAGFAWEPENPATFRQLDLVFYLEEAKRLLHRHLKLFLYLLRDNPDLFVAVFFDPDRVLHLAMDRLDKDPFDSDVLGYFEELDWVLGELLAELSDYHIVVVSDHGMQLSPRVLDLNIWLLRQGLLKVNCNLLSVLRFLAWKLGWTPELAWRIVRSSRKRAEVEKGLTRRSGLMNFVRFFFLSDKDVQGPLALSLGVVYPLGYETELLAAITACSELECLRPSEEPPWIVRAGDPSIVVVATRTFRRHDPFGSPPEPGQHSQDGIFLCSEPLAEPPRTLEGASGLVASWLGVPHPGEPIDAETPGLSEEETAVVEERLRALGYL